MSSTKYLVFFTSDCGGSGFGSCVISVLFLSFFRLVEAESSEASRNYRALLSLLDWRKSLLLFRFPHHFFHTFHHVILREGSQIAFLNFFPEIPIHRNLKNILAISSEIEAYNLIHFYNNLRLRGNFLSPLKSGRRFEIIMRIQFSPVMFKINQQFQFRNSRRDQRRQIALYA